MEASNDQLLREGAKEIGFCLSEKQVSDLEKYLEVLLKWNRAFNLTSVKTEAEAVKKHLLDCLAIVPAVMMEAESRQVRSIADVGSGAGLPAAVLAVCLPGIEVYSVDAVAKKTSFVRQAAIEVGIGNLHPVHSRIENVGMMFDIAVCRAFSSLRDFVFLTGGCLAEGGCWLAMKGSVPEGEIRDLPGSVTADKVMELRVPGLDERRSLVRIVRIRG